MRRARCGGVGGGRAVAVGAIVCVRVPVMSGSGCRTSPARSTKRPSATASRSAPPGPPAGGPGPWCGWTCGGCGATARARARARARPGIGTPPTFAGIRPEARRGGAPEVERQPRAAVVTANVNVVRLERLCLGLENPTEGGSQPSPGSLQVLSITFGSPTLGRPSNNSPSSCDKTKQCLVKGDDRGRGWRRRRQKPRCSGMRQSLRPRPPGAAPRATRRRRGGAREVAREQQPLELLL